MYIYNVTMRNEICYIFSSPKNGNSNWISLKRNVSLQSSKREYIWQSTVVLTHESRSPSTHI